MGRCYNDGPSDPRPRPNYPQVCCTQFVLAQATIPRPPMYGRRAHITTLAPYATLPQQQDTGSTNSASLEGAEGASRHVACMRLVDLLHAAALVGGPGSGVLLQGGDVPVLLVPGVLVDAQAQLDHAVDAAAERVGLVQAVERGVQGW